MKQEETEQKDILKDITDKEYEYGFVSDIDIEDFPKGLNEEIVRRISQRKGEPDWLLEFRLKAYRYWTTLEEPDWGHLEFEKPNYQDIRYLAIQSIPSWSIRSTSWASTSKSRKCWRAWPWTRSWTPSP